MKCGVIAAMSTELSRYLAEWNCVGRFEKSGRTFHFAKLDGGDEAILVECGIGKVNAAVSAQILCDFGIDFLINSGIAGGIEKSLRLFDFVASSDLVQHDFDLRKFGYERALIPGFAHAEFAADERLVAAALNAGGTLGLRLCKNAAESEKAKDFPKLLVGRIASGDQFIADEDVKSEIESAFHPACVEMEGCAVAQVASLNKVPFIALRCISDMADKAADAFDEKVAAEKSARFVEEMLKSL